MPTPEEDRLKAKAEFEEKMMRRSGSAPQSKVKAEYEVVKGDTLSGIALKFYGSAAKEKWMIIYEANKDVIGDNPNLIRPGQVLKIPEE